MKSQFNRSAIYIALGLSIALVVGVLVGAKVVDERTELEPVAISPVPSDEADSPECAAFVDALPDSFQGHDRAKVAEPVPPGVAAWASDSVNSITARCGVDLPAQYTELAETEDASGARWLPVRDMTPGSGLITWYTVDRSPVAALTTFEEGKPRGLDAAMEALDGDEHSPNGVPLAQLDERAGGECAALDDALPTNPAEGYTRADKDGAVETDTRGEVTLPENTAVWTAHRREPIVLRCGVEPPPGYTAGKRIQQVNDIPWFQDTTLAEGTTTGVWYALGRSTDIAVSVPQDTADSVLVKLSNAIAKAMPEETAPEATPREAKEKEA